MNNITKDKIQNWSNESLSLFLSMFWLIKCFDFKKKKKKKKMMNMWNIESEMLKNKTQIQEYL